MEQRDNLTAIEAFYLSYKDPNLEISYMNTNTWATHKERLENNPDYSYSFLALEPWSIRTRKTDKDKLKDELERLSYTDAVLNKSIHLNTVVKQIDKYWPKNDQKQP